MLAYPAIHTSFHLEMHTHLSQDSDWFPFIFNKSSISRLGTAVGKFVTAKINQSFQIEIMSRALQKALCIIMLNFEVNSFISILKKKKTQTKIHHIFLQVYLTPWLKGSLEECRFY